jgi:hypothetical protein
MDLAGKAQFFALDVISDVGFGQSFGDLERDEDVYGYAQAAETTQRLIPVFYTTGLARVFQIEWIARLVFPSD